VVWATRGLVVFQGRNKPNHFKPKQLFEASSFIVWVAFFISLSFSRSPRVGEGIQILIFILLKKEIFSCSCSLKTESDFFH